MFLCCEGSFFKNVEEVRSSSPVANVLPVRGAYKARTPGATVVAIAIHFIAGIVDDFALAPQVLRIFVSKRIEHACDALGVFLEIGDCLRCGGCGGSGMVGV